MSKSELILGTIILSLSVCVSGVMFIVATYKIVKHFI